MKTFTLSTLMLALGLTGGYFGYPYLMETHSTSIDSTSMKSDEKAVDYWVAPMDATFRRDKPGKSPMGMDLVPVYKKQPKPTEKVVDYWVAPMDATFRRDKPGKSPMGMDLVPVYKKQSGQAEDPAAVYLEPSVINNLGVRTAKVTTGTLAKQIKTVAYVGYDETKINHVHLRTSGWIEKLYIKSEGEYVKRGQVILEVYSPLIVNAQEEYLQVIGSKLKGMVVSANSRLRSLGMSQGQINQLKKRKKPYQRIRIYAPRDGIISKLTIGEGMYVKPEMNIMTVADLSSVWLMVDVFEKQTNWVEKNQRVTAQFSYLPGKNWEGVVDYIYPELDPMTRTFKVRLHFPNPGGKLKPNMYGKVKIYTQEKNNALSIPREAIIHSGEKTHVIVKNEDGGFKPRTIETGIESGNQVEVLSGLSKNETVVTSAQFLIDSEASLKASFLRVTPVKKEENITKAKPENSIPQFSGAGVVEGIDAENALLTLTHDPIEALGWPKMKMDLKVADNIEINHLTIGEKIHFTLDKYNENTFVICKIHRMEAEK